MLGTLGSMLDDMYTSGKVLQNVDDDSSDVNLKKVTKLQRQLRDRTVFETSWYSYKGFVYNINVRSQVDILTYYMPQSVCLFSMIVYTSAMLDAKDQRLLEDSPE